MGKFHSQKLERLYAEQMGADAFERQQKAATRAKGGCACNVRTVRKRWDGLQLSERKLHEPFCPRWRWWMEEADRLESRP